jgi:EAL domain-containing protein (putative c-di-GMP-specific phosphodiesterase class I)
MKTLVIDDDPFALKLLGHQLSTLGCDDVTLCGWASEAVSLLEAQGDAIGLIFCDLQMPDVDGVEFVRHLSRIDYRGCLVLVSGEDERLIQTVHKLALAHRIRIIGAIQKPVSPERLREVLAKAAQAVDAPSAALRSYSPDELKRAIAAGELVNHYQPKVDLATGAVVGVEALVRWQHPQAGLVYPDRFISLAEDHGLIDELTHAVLVVALRQARCWQDAGRPLQVAVNVSMDNLAALDFPDVVARLAGEAGVALSNLALELTESRLMKSSLVPMEILTRLRLKRIKLSIDDFGTGHSSLAQLRDIPFDELKLDRSFIDGVSRDPALKAIVEATLAMARELGIDSVAEGVEGRADWDFLRKVGCDVAQGYFIARPMPGSDVAGWLAGWELRRPGLGVPTP